MPSDDEVLIDDELYECITVLCRSLVLKLHEDPPPQALTTGINRVGFQASCRQSDQCQAVQSGLVRSFCNSLAHSTVQTLQLNSS